MPDILLLVPNRSWALALDLFLTNMSFFVDVAWEVMGDLSFFVFVFACGGHKKILLRLIKWLFNHFLWPNWLLFDFLRVAFLFGLDLEEQGFLCGLFKLL